MTDRNKVVVILSGGMDSAVLLWHEKSLGWEVRALSFDYGQRHRTELYSAEGIARVAGVPWEIIDISEVGKHLKGSSQTDASVEVPHGHYTDESMKKTVVPNRNMIMLSIAVGYAAGLGFGRVVFAAHAGDHAIYPDCRAEFVGVLAEAVRIATEWHPVALESPLVEFTKAEIAKYGAVLDVPFELTWSCYEGDGGTGHCGRCGTCVERMEAFKLSGVPDPTVYAGR